MKFTPTFIFGFANDKTKYLNGIDNERNKIQQSLMPLNAKNKIKCPIIDKLDIDTLFETFNHYTGEIVAFHFGGHADSESLHLEDGVASYEGIAELIGQENHIEFIFLNGCKTYSQIDFFFKNKVKIVIATKNNIDDVKAVEFSSQFYKVLATGGNIETAFNKAIAFLKAKYSISEDDIHRAGGLMNQQKELSSWNLFINKQFDNDVLKWSLESLLRDNLSVPTKILLDNVDLPIHKDWTNRIKKDLQSFKPKTALEHLNALEVALSSSESYNSLVKASVKHLKAIIYDELGNPNEGEKYHYEAYSLANEVILYQEKVLLLYAAKQENARANDLINSILTIEPFNSIAWATKVFLDSDGPIEKKLSKVPLEVFDIKHESYSFKSNLANLMLRFKYPIDEIYSVFKDDLDNDINALDIVDINNKRYWLLLASLKMERSFQYPFMLPDKQNTQISSDKNLIVGLELLKKILSFFDNTEKRDYLTDHYFNLALGKYYVEGKEENALEMYQRLKQFKNINEGNRLLFTSFALAQTKLYTQLLEITNNEFDIPFLCLIPRFHALKELGKIQDAKNCLDNYFQKLEKIEGYDLKNLMSYCEFFKLEEYELLCFFEKCLPKFSSDVEKEIAEVIIFRKIKNRDWQLANLNRVYQDTNIKNYHDIIALLYAEIKEFERAIEILKNEINFDSESENLPLYISCMIQSHSDDEQLLELLKQWREKEFQPLPEFLEREIQLLVEIAEWSEIEEVTRYGLTKYPKDPFLLFYKFWALKKMKRNQELQTVLIDTILSIKLEQKLAIHFAIYAMDEGLIEVALRLVYPLAKVKNNIQARRAYFEVFGLSDRYLEIIKELEVVEDNSVIEVEHDGTKEFLLFRSCFKTYLPSF